MEWLFHSYEAHGSAYALIAYCWLNKRLLIGYEKVIRGVKYVIDRKIMKDKH